MFYVSVHPSGEVACSGGEDDKARVWKVTDGTTLFMCEGKYYYIFKEMKHTILCQY